LLLVATSLAVAQPFTRRSSQPQHDGLKQYYEIPNFRLGGRYEFADPQKWEFGGEGGTTLESLSAGKLRTAYIAVGTPRRNTAGEITNAVVISSYYSGDSTDMYEQWVKGTALSGGVPIIGPGRPIDTDRYYVVMVDPLGTWGASKPSDGLGTKFPQYSYYDMVQANYRMLRDHLKVANVALAAGVSMGGTQTYVWGVMHPEYVQALMPIGGTTQSDAEDPVGNWTFQLMTAAIESDPVWQATKGVYDAVELVWRNRVGEIHNINPYLDRIRSRTLVMHITNDLWLNFKLAQRTVDKIPGADLIAEESPVAHYGMFSIINNRKHDAKLVAFLEDVARLNKQQQFAAKNYRVAAVAADIDPKKSFWKDFVTYPFPVKYANVKDGTGTSWQIGYMDEYAGTDRNPPVLVVVHGKGAFAGHYGNVIKQAVESGIRVIAPDLPHYGMLSPRSRAGTS
jgi:homoserine acetyltransferase